MTGPKSKLTLDKWRLWRTWAFSLAAAAAAARRNNDDNRQHRYVYGNLGQGKEQRGRCLKRKSCWQCCLFGGRGEGGEGHTQKDFWPAPKVTMIIENLHGRSRVSPATAPPASASAPPPASASAPAPRMTIATLLEADIEYGIALLSTLLTDRKRKRERAGGAARGAAWTGSQATPFASPGQACLTVSFC